MPDRTENNPAGCPVGPGQQGAPQDGGRETSDRAEWKPTGVKRYIKKYGCYPWSSTIHICPVPEPGSIVLSIEKVH